MDEVELRFIRRQKARFAENRLLAKLVWRSDLRIVAV